MKKAVINNQHSLEWDEFRPFIDKLESLDDILLISKNLNEENTILLKTILSVNEDKDKHISKIDDLYKKKEIIMTNKKFEIKKNKEINIDLYYNNMANIEKIISLSVSEFKDFIEKGNTIEQNDGLLNLISKEIEECEKNINELNNKIIELTSEKDEKWRRWSYLYESYRKMISNLENKPDIKLNNASPTENDSEQEEKVKAKKTIKKKDNKNNTEITTVEFKDEKVLELNNIVDEKSEKKVETLDNVKEIVEPVKKAKRTIKKKTLEATTDNVDNGIENNINKEDTSVKKKDTKKKE